MKRAIQRLYEQIRRQYKESEDPNQEDNVHKQMITRKYIARRKRLYDRRAKLSLKKKHLGEQLTPACMTMEGWKLCNPQTYLEVGSS